MRFLEADVRFAEAKLNFFQINRNIFRSTDSSIDLLKGYESLPPNTDPQINVYNIENLLYKNVREIMSSKGLTLSDILTKTGISQLIVGNEEDILFQKSRRIPPSIFLSHPQIFLISDRKSFCPKIKPDFCYFLPKNY
jgi:hypothetical protein